MKKLAFGAAAAAVAGYFEPEEETVLKPGVSGESGINGYTGPTGCTGPTHWLDDEESEQTVNQVVKILSDRYPGTDIRVTRGSTVDTVCIFHHKPKDAASLYEECRKYIEEFGNNNLKNKVNKITAVGCSICGTHYGMYVIYHPENEITTGNSA